MILLAGFYLFGCAKKETAKKEVPPEPMSIEELSLLTANATNTTAQKISIETKPPVAPLVNETKAELPTLTPVVLKPTVQEIQIALKNAGYYTGAIDGKIGPKTKKAIEEFQKANNLKVDGIVGPKTWALLSKYLKPVSSDSTKR